MDVADGSKAYIEILSPYIRLISIDFSSASSFAVGRDPAVSHVSFESLATVSGLHLTISCRKSADNVFTYVATDSSQNGTWINAEKLVKRVETNIQDGDVVVLAKRREFAPLNGIDVPAYAAKVSKSKHPFPVMVFRTSKPKASPGTQNSGVVQLVDGRTSSSSHSSCGASQVRVAFGNHNISFKSVASEVSDVVTKESRIVDGLAAQLVAATREADGLRRRVDALQESERNLRAEMEQKIASAARRAAETTERELRTEFNATLCAARQSHVAETRVVLSEKQRELDALRQELTRASRADATTVVREACDAFRDSLLERLRSQKRKQSSMNNTQTSEDSSCALESHATQVVPIDQLAARTNDDTGSLVGSQITNWSSSAKNPKTQPTPVSLQRRGR